MNVGDLVKMKRGYSEPGLIIEFTLAGRWARVLWPDYGHGLEKIRDLEVISENR